MVKEAKSREFALFVQHIYRQTKTQKVVLTLMLAAVPSPPNKKNWKIPLSVDIAEFNNGHQGDIQFSNLIATYHRSLLNLTKTLVILEFDLNIGIRNFTSKVNYLIFMFSNRLQKHL